MPQGRAGDIVERDYQKEQTLPSVGIRQKMKKI